jgi:hypothetical protein
MHVLVACEFSGIVRDAFRDRGHDAWSCDLLPSERDGPHLREDIFDVLRSSWMVWDLMVAFPPCTYLCRAGDRWYARSAKRRDALQFVEALAAAPIPRMAIENPRGLNRFWRKADQVIQPWMFGHGETKATCLWLRNLPPLLATVVSSGREPRVAYAPPGAERWKVRSRTLPGIAAAMAEQWSTG